MFKRLSVILAVMVLLGMAVSIVTPVTSQAVIMQSPDARVKTAIWTGTTADGYTPTAGSALTSQNRIVGWAISGSSSPIVGFYDAPTTTGLGALDTEVFDEPACASNSPVQVWYPAPKTLTYGLQVIRNSKVAGYCTIIVFYE